MDLTATDPYFAVPALSAAVIVGTLYMGYDPTGAASANKYVKAFKYIGIPAVVFFFSTRVPAVRFSSSFNIIFCSKKNLISQIKKISDMFFNEVDLFFYQNHQ
ncbi:unnamed protein product [Gongylonema pulchrum]|uniref:Amino acid permease n=1 Tax=Gongylonema pulchrum TaxID=637853 RepID=A0A183DAS6_9BILA|nr:unnamed protein product [Gongylonema pulchrum]